MEKWRTTTRKIDLQTKNWGKKRLFRRINKFIWEFSMGRKYKRQIAPFLGNFSYGDKESDKKDSSSNGVIPSEIMDLI